MSGTGPDDADARQKDRFRDIVTGVFGLVFALSAFSVTTADYASTDEVWQALGLFTPAFFFVLLIWQIAADLRLVVRTGPLLGAWIYRDVVPDVDMFVVTYGCYPPEFNPKTLGGDEREVSLFRMNEIDVIPLAEGYRRSIKTWARDPRSINRWT